MQGGGAFFGKIRQAWRIRETGEEAGRGLEACVFYRPCMVDTMEKRRRRIRGLAETAARARQEGEDGGSMGGNMERLQRI